MTTTIDEISPVHGGPSVKYFVLSALLLSARIRSIVRCGIGVATGDGSAIVDGESQ